MIQQPPQENSGTARQPTTPAPAAAPSPAPAEEPAVPDAEAPDTAAVPETTPDNDAGELTEHAGAAAEVVEEGRSRPTIASASFSALTYLLVAVASALIVVIALSMHHALAYQRTLDGIKRSLRSVESALATAQSERTTYVAAPSGGTGPECDQLLQLAAAAERENDLPKAEAFYRDALKADVVQHHTDEIRYRLGSCLLRQGRSSEALAELRTVVSAFRNSPFYARAAFEMAELHMQRGEPAQARRILYQLIALRDALGAEDREYVELAHYAIARCYEMEADSVAASRSSAGELLDNAISRTGKPR